MQRSNASKQFDVIEVVRVVDGDTIDVLLDLGFDVRVKKRVRLTGIDTPECRSSDPDEKRFGKLAKKQMKEWCFEHALSVQIRCKKDKLQDKFGRVLGEVWVEHKQSDSPTSALQVTNVNQWMCNNHYAVRYYGQSKSDVADDHLENRRKLRELGKCSE